MSDSKPKVSVGKMVARVIGPAVFLQVRGPACIQYVCKQLQQEIATNCAPESALIAA
jgi:hypothetical protein